MCVWKRGDAIITSGREGMRERMCICVVHVYVMLHTCNVYFVVKKGIEGGREWRERTHALTSTSPSVVTYSLV